MNLHEFQAKQLFREVGIPVPRSEVVDTPTAAVEAARQLGGKQWIVKAQVHAGERTAVGGVRCINDLDQLLKFSQLLLGECLITPQNAPDGQPVNQLLIEVPFAIEHAYFLSVTIAPYSGKIVFLAANLDISPEPELSGVVPEGYHRIEIDPLLGLQDYQCRQLAVKLGLNKAVWGDFFEILKGLYLLLIEKDLMLIEIDSLAESLEGEFAVLSAKVSVDDNALPRQAELAGLVDYSQDNFHQYLTMSHGLAFISLAGDIGCVVNGSGLALATLDLVQLKGGHIGKIVDVGDGVSSDDLAEALRFVWDGGQCRAILVNVVGGIVQCDIVAAGVLEGAKLHNVHCPIVVRMEGTKADEAQALLMQSDQHIKVIQDLDVAVMLAISSVAE